MRLIDANALWDKAEEMYIHIRGEKYAPVMAVSSHAINNAPDIEAVTVRHGKWVDDRPNHYKCSECKSIWGNAARVMKYCPNCGAKMDGGVSDGTDNM